MKSQTNRPELLAPAGSMESAVAAIENGADALYVGLSELSARQHAKNVTPDALGELVRTCHIRDVKVYVTLNTMLYDDQLPLALSYLQTCCDCGVDGVILQDLGLAALAKERFPLLPLHASTQMTVHTPAGAKLLKELGFCRVVLARELTLQEIKTIIEQVEVETEVFIHGALCMSVSGQCYLSAMIGGRSGNKGGCAGTCRLPFSLGGKDEYALSLKDLCAASALQALTELGVTSWKIEGRMKRPEYVAAAVQAYVAARDGQPADWDTLRSVFSRDGFTDAYLTGQCSPSMFGIRRKEDVLGATQDLLAALRESYRKTKAHIPITMTVCLQADRPVRLVWQDEAGHRVQIEGDIPQAAQKLPLTEQDVQTALTKLGGTPYFCKDFQVELEEGLFLPKAAFNALRREAVAQMDELRAYRPPLSYPAPAPLVFPGRNRTSISPQVIWRVERLSQLPENWQELAQAVIVPIASLQSDEDAWKPYVGRIIAEPPRAMFGQEESVRAELAKLKAAGISTLAASNPAHIRLAKELIFDVFGTHFLNVANSAAVAAYQSLGAERLTLSTEMTVAQMRRVQADLPLGAVVYGGLPLMLFRYCPLRQGRSCTDCDQKGFVTDRLGNRFPIRCGAARTPQLYNCRILDCLQDKASWQNFDFVSFYFTDESPAQILSLHRRWELGAPPAGDFTRGLYRRGVDTKERGQ